MSIKRHSTSRSSVDSGIGGGAGAGELVDKLMEMGISERSARYALKKTNGNLERAANYVFSGEANKEEVSKSIELSGEGLGPGIGVDLDRVGSTNTENENQIGMTDEGSARATIGSRRVGDGLREVRGIGAGVVDPVDQVGEGEAGSSAPRLETTGSLDIPLANHIVQPSSQVTAAIIATNENNNKPILRPTPIDRDGEQDERLFSPLIIAEATTCAPSPIKINLVGPIGSHVHPGSSTTVEEEEKEDPLPSTRSGISGQGVPSTPPMSLSNSMSMSLSSSSSMSGGVGLGVIHEHEGGQGEGVPELDLGESRVVVGSVVDGLPLAPRVSLDGSGLLVKRQMEPGVEDVGGGIIPDRGLGVGTPASRRSSVTFNQPPSRPIVSDQNPDPTDISQSTPSPSHKPTPTTTKLPSSVFSSDRDQSRERDLPRSETITSFEMGSESDYDDARGRSLVQRAKGTGAGMFKRGKRRRKVVDPSSSGQADDGSSSLTLRENSLVGDPIAIETKLIGVKEGTGSKRMSFFAVGTKIMDMMSARKKGENVDPVALPNTPIVGEAETKPPAETADEAGQTSHDPELESKKAHVTRSTRKTSRDRDQTIMVSSSRSPNANANATTKQSRQDSEASSSSNPMTKTPSKGILKITNDTIDPSFAYDPSQSVYSPSRPGSVFFASPAGSVFVSPAGSPSAMMLPLPMMDDGDDGADNAVPGTSTQPCNDPDDATGLDHDNDATSDHTDADTNSTRTITPTSSKHHGLGGLAMSTISPSSESPTRSTPVSTSTSATSMSSGSTIVSPRNDDQQANELIMGALNRNTGHGHHEQHITHKSPSPGSLSSTKTTGTLAALGLKAMGPGLGGFGGGQETVLPSQPVGASSHGAGIVNLSSTPPEKDSGGLFSSFAPREKERGRSKSKRDKYKIFGRKSLAAGSAGLGGPRSRDTSPVGALSEHAESDGESVTSSSRGYRPKSTAFSSKRRSTDGVDDSDEDDASEGDETEGETETEYDDIALSHEIVGEDGWVEDVFDEETEKNTEANAIYFEGDAAGLGGTGVLEDENGEEVEVEVDVLGEGPNVIRPPEPIFQQSTMNRRAPSPVSEDGSKRKKPAKSEPERLDIARPEFGRNRCTVRMTQGDPDHALERAGTSLRSYVVLSDLSEEAGYALQWAIGTVARDGDELLVTTVMETDSKIDPKNANEQDRVTKLRVQKERQGVALQLVRQVTGLLQRTKLNVTVTCQAIHSKNARHMLLDLIDYLEPTMVIVGSRGLGKLSGILLGSTSHYLVQKSSVPVMVARRRLKKPLRKTDPALLRHAPRVSLAGASIEKSASKKQEDDILDAESLEREGELEDQKKESSGGAFSNAA